MLCTATVAAAAPGAQAQTLAEVLSVAQPPAGGVAGSLFGSTEFSSASLQGLPQWQNILRRMESEGPAFSGCTGDAEACGSPALRSWRQLQVAAAPLGRMDKLHIVNRYFNRWPYKSDRETYGQSEFWASPSVFMARSGDCEDYAIAKFFALRQLGFQNDELRIVVLYDRIRAIGHAVLAVYDENDILILDSLSNFITTHNRYRHYLPQYSMNETTRWAHVDRTRAIPRTAFRANGQ